MCESGCGDEASGANADGETDEDGQTLLDGLSDRLAEQGVEPSRLETAVDRDASPLDALVETAAEFDAVVMVESDPSLPAFVFGMPTDQVAERFLAPVLVVQRSPETDAR
ncbi:hypothetical protein [Halomicrobium katesii]|uniref:hypothetical protein n=1 Tax=Halomicrobium katesii TaxID=437163 RepID=UPI0003807763|nr:hypothetical protein [Halomicrobium katesii]